MGGVSGAKRVCDWLGAIGINNNYFTFNFHCVFFKPDNIKVSQYNYYKCKKDRNHFWGKSVVT